MENSYSACKNIKSKRDPKLRCPNAATKGDYCGIHYKHPEPWTSAVPKVKRISKKKLKVVAEHEAATNIQQWYRYWIGHYFIKTRGPAYYHRILCVNDVDFFSTDPIQDISGVMFFSYKDTKNHVHGFDIRSIATLISMASDKAAVENPFTRDHIPINIANKVLALVDHLKAHKIPTTWAKLEPSTPIQQYRMKVVDLFALIDELNYYSSPDWFLNLTLEQHRKFYKELHAIWTYRANLTPQQKQMIVPNYTQNIFRQMPYVTALYPLDRIQKLNLATIRALITSAQDKNDKIVGAMYVMSTLTIVCEAAKAAYPWLYESTLNGDDVMDMNELNFPRLPIFFGMGGWINDILNITAPRNPPPLLLPPPQNPD